MADKSECIQVVVRCRPFNKKEKEENRTHIIDINSANRSVTMKAPPGTTPRSLLDAQKTFTFDAVYDENTQQRIFYDESCFNLVENVLEGFNATIFAYGQTGCGKSWTMQGPTNPPELHGVIPNSFSHLFDHIDSTDNVEFLVRCSYLEIYNEEIKDLLSDPKSKLKCELKEDPQKGVFVKNLTDVVVESKVDLQKMLDKGLACRTVAATLMNDNSSRSHSIFTIVVEMSTKNDKGEDHIRAGKLNLVDLAGSERQKKTGASGALLKEGAKINLSLSALGNVISALAENKNKHIPYRDSKLTRLLQDSLGGNTKTLMVAAISPADYNHEETLSTLRYANRAKNIQNKPKVNEDPKETLLREYKEEIERLKKLLESQSGLGAGGINGQNQPPSQVIQNEIQKEAARISLPLEQFIPTTDNEPNSAKEEKESPDNETKQSTATTTATTNDNNYEISTSLEDAEEVLNKRLNSLQSKLVHHSSLSNLLSEKTATDNNNGNTVQPVPVDPKQKAELDEAKKRYKERKLEAKRKREIKQKQMQEEMQKILDEKNEEMEELQKANYTGQSQLDKLEAKYSKIKKRYEKKLNILQMELDDVNDELYNQRQLMQDSLVSQDHDLKLYEQICRQLLSDKEFNRIVEKSKWDDDREEWIIPFLKQANLANYSTPSHNMNNSNNNRGSRSASPSVKSEQNLQGSISGFLPIVNNNNKQYTDNLSQSRSAQELGYGGGAGVGLPSLLPSGHATAASGPPSGSRAGSGTAGGNMLKGPENSNTTKPKNKKKKKKNKEYNAEVASGRPAGDISEWGFLHPQNGADDEDEYEDDEDFVNQDVETASTGKFHTNSNDHPSRQKSPARTTGGSNSTNNNSKPPLKLPNIGGPKLPAI